MRLPLRTAAIRGHDAELLWLVFMKRILISSPDGSLIMLKEEATFQWPQIARVYNR
jgi:hypothetical protein